MADMDKRRHSVTKDQRTGHKHLAERSMQAATTGAPNAPDKPVYPQIAMGVTVVAVALAISFILSKINPSPDQGQSEIMATQSGGLYVAYSAGPGEPKKLHPALNLASARLIAGSANKPTVVKDDVLAEYPRGLPMGIPSAPNSLEHSLSTDHDAGWGVCTFHDARANLSLTRADSLRTIAVAGADAWEGGTELSNGRAMVVRPSDDLSRRYLLFDTYRAELGADDYAIHSALGIPQSAIDNAAVVSPGMLNTIETKPKVAVPPLDRFGLESSAMPGKRIGDVLTTTGADSQRRYHVVLDDGLQVVPVTVAEILTVGGASITPVSDPAAIADVPQLGDIDTAAYPPAMPTLVDDASLCSVWTKPRPSQPGQPSTAPSARKLITADSLPITRELSDSLVDQLDGDGREVVDQFTTAPGKGWYVRITGDGRQSDLEGQIAYIDDTGIRYDVVPDDQGVYTPVVGALGLTGQPTPIPDAIARLLVKGPDLDARAALVQRPSGASGAIVESDGTDHGDLAPPEESDEGAGDDPFIGRRGPARE